MAEWLRRLTRNQMGSSNASTDLADCEILRSSKLNTTTAQKLSKKNVIPWHKKSYSSSTNDDRSRKNRYFGMQLWLSRWGAGLEIWWDFTAQVLIPPSAKNSFYSTQHINIQEALQKVYLQDSLTNRKLSQHFKKSWPSMIHLMMLVCKHGQVVKERLGIRWVWHAQVQILLTAEFFVLQYSTHPRTRRSQILKDVNPWKRKKNMQQVRKQWQTPKR